MSLVLRNPIGWCDVTGNAVIGCEKVSPGCAGCYAENDTPARVLRHRGIETWGPKGTRMPIAGFAAKARRLNRFCICDQCRQTAPFEKLLERCPAYYPQGPAVETRRCHGFLRRIRFFADSNGDWLDKKWPLSSLVTLLQTVHECPNLDFQLLTKRPENFRERLLEVFVSLPPLGELNFECWVQGWLTGNPPGNVWFGISGENRKELWSRWGHAKIIPAKVYLLSLEPLLEDVADTLHAVLTEAKALGKTVWPILGGESGKRARPCDVDWIRNGVRICQQHGVPCYVKQIGRKAISVAYPDNVTEKEAAIWMVEGWTRMVGFPGGEHWRRFHRLKHKSGADWAEWPEDLWVRQFPEARA